MLYIQKFQVSVFDTLDYSITLKKWSGFEMPSGFVQFMKAYLGYHSKKFVLMSGAPQGSNLGPLLFTIYMDDFFTHLKCPALAYADDMVR